jgi:hypothetical protein
LGHDVFLGILEWEGCSVGEVQNPVPSGLPLPQVEDVEEADTAGQQLLEGLMAAFLFTNYVMETLTPTLGTDEASARLVQGVVWKTIANGLTANEILSRFWRPDFSPQTLGENGFSYIQSLDLMPNLSEDLSFRELGSLDVVPVCPPEFSRSAQAVILRITTSLPHDASLFTTDNGHIGMSYSPIEKGDELCVLAGCKLPVVLRRDNDKHTLNAPHTLMIVIHSESREDRSSFETEVS